MKVTRRSAQKGFTLVELLAVVLILAVLAAVAIPSYLNTRKTSAARTCKANIAAIAAAESAYAVRFGTYNSGTWTAAYTAGAAGTAPTGGLIGAPEGLAETPKCPLDSTAVYTITAAGNDITIACPNSAQHATDTGAAPTTWSKLLTAAKADTTNPL